VTLSGEEFLITPNNISVVGDDSGTGGRRLQAIGTAAAIGLAVVFVGAAVESYSGGSAANVAKAESIGAAVGNATAAG